MKTALLVGSLAAADLVSALQDDSHPNCQTGPLAKNTVCDMTADPVTRAKALISLFTLEEKFNNTGSVSPGVPRIGLPPYTWWQEALHGVASSPGVNFSAEGDFSYATSFPEPITMGASFDDDLIKSVATIISTEARAFNNANRSGLDFWTPNINPFKDPRWGRGQETPGEDPYHLTSYVKSLIDGLQGGYDPKYKRIVATCKHFVGYDMESWNGNWRYQWDAPLEIQDLVEYYTPSFKGCVDANVGAFMCSYNAANGVPSCANSYILEDILRKHWGWTNDNQWVTSDCDAIQNVYLPHEWMPTRAESVAASLKAGVDLNCGTYYQNHLPAAYAQGLITEDDVDQALIRLYSSLVRLGYFDSDEVQPYRQLGWSDVNTPNAQYLAYTAAAEGIVLLKNDGTLPLDLTGKTVALIGSWANATKQMQGNYYGVAPYLISPLLAAEKIAKVIYVEGPGGQGDPTTNSWLPVWAAANQSDVILYFDGIDNSVESEGMDRLSIAWTGAQLDVIGQLAEYGKPMVVAQMGGGQIDSSPLKNNPNIGALLWGGYPGQSGGQALLDIITGKVAPAGRLPTTQYPADYISQVPMTDMSLRPGPRSPGRTYKWYTGEAVYPFGSGIHYTNFTASVTPATRNSSPSMLNAASSKFTFGISDLTKSCNTSSNSMLDCAFITLQIDIENSGSVKSDYVALLFLTGKFGPTPYPIKSLVSYARAHNITGGSSQTVSLPLTLGSLGRVDAKGNTLLYPGDYSLQLDNTPLLTVNFTLTGRAVTLDQWPQPNQGKATGVEWIGEEYFVGGYGSEGIIMANSTS